MAIQNSDLLYVQRGTTPLKTTASALSTFVNTNVDTGLTKINATAPVAVSAVSNKEQTVSMPSATNSRDGYMSKELVTQLENIASNPDGLLAVLAGDNITVNTTVSPGASATPQVGVTPNSFIPYNISTLTTLP